mgnify:FL=1
MEKLDTWHSGDCEERMMTDAEEMLGMDSGHMSEEGC